MRDLPAQQAKLERKFMHLAVREVGDNRAAEIAAVTRDLENHSVRDLLSLCGA